MLRISRVLIVLFCLYPVSVAAIPSLQQNQKQRLVTEYGQLGDGSHHVVLNNGQADQKQPTFLPVVYLSVANSVINILRPDAAIIWQV